MGHAPVYPVLVDELEIRTMSGASNFGIRTEWLRSARRECLLQEIAGHKREARQRQYPRRGYPTDSNHEANPSSSGEPPVA